MFIIVILVIVKYTIIMNNFTNFSKFTELNEAAKRVNTDVMTTDDIGKYLDAVNKRIPKQVADIIYLTIKYKLQSQKAIDDIRNATKGQLDKLAFNYNIPVVEIEDLWKNLKDLKSNLRLLPQYQSASERKAFMAGKLIMSDITIDLDSSAGRNNVAKQYMSMAQKIVNDYVGKSRLSKPELISAALQGLTDAMNDWRKNDKDDSKSVPFKTYAAYRIKQQILNDINSLSYTMKTNWYAVKKAGSTLLNSISLDGFSNDNEDEFKQDRFAALGFEDPNYNLTKNEEEQWQDLYKIIEKTFKQRDINVFYRYFGLNGHQREKGKDIAKSLGISPSLVKGIVTDIVLKTLKKDPKAMDILMNLQAAYNESLMLDIIGMDKDMMIESILSDDTFIFLEELTRWSNKDVYISALNNSLDALGDEYDLIEDLLKGNFDNLDKKFKSNKKLIIRFLSEMYPTENFSRKTDVALLEYMSELGELYKKYVK